MNTTLQKVVSKLPITTLVERLSGTVDEKELVLFIYKELDTNAASVYEELKTAKNYITTVESAIVLDFFLKLATKYNSLKKFIPDLVNNIR
jgi:hypothetical protein